MAGDLETKIKEYYKQVEGWLLWYNERRQEYLNTREAIIHSGGHSLPQAAGGQTEYSDPTGRKAEKLADIKYTEDWLKFVADLENSISDEFKALLHLRRDYRFCRGRTGWTVALQRRYEEKTGYRVGGRSTLHLWWRDLVNCATVLAAKKGLLQ